MAEKISLCGIDIDNVSFADSLDAVDSFIKKGEAAYIVTPNVDCIVKLQKDEDFQAIYRNASLVLADGMPLLWAAKFLGIPLKEKVSGSDLLPRLCAVAVDKGYRVFFLGGREGAARKTAEVLKARHPGLQVAGYYAPPFGFEKDEAENEKVVRMIKEAKPDILFVGLGAPKQEKWIFRYKDEYRVPVSVGIGGSFELIAGVVKRAPVWMQRAGLEWFWRLMMEPRRLWRRYIIEDLVFFWLVWEQKLRRRRIR